MGSTASIPSEEFVTVGATLKAAYEQAVAEGKSPDEIKLLLTTAFDTATAGAASTETPAETPPVVEDVSSVADTVDASKEEPVVVVEAEVPAVAIEGEVPAPVDEVKA